ncbi:MAG: 2-hydroxyacid dehydrogenase [Microbacteriaceae bacterium]
MVTRILQAGPMMGMLEDDLNGEFSVLRIPEHDSSKYPADNGSVHDESVEFLRQNAGGIEIAVTTGEAGLSGEQILAMPHLRAIANFGAGYDATDVATARARGIVIGNTPDVLTDCVADLAVGLLISVLRGIGAADRFVRRGKWVDGPFPLAAKVTGKRVGIVGLGRIGRAIANRLGAFEMTISYHNRHRVLDVPFHYADSVQQLAAECDVLIVAATGGPESAGLVSADVLAALGPAGYLINVARGSVIDETALVQALTDGTIAGAGLDVFTDEPRVPLALLNMENVVLVPHIGSGTMESRRAMADLVLANIRQFLADGTLVTPVY